MKHGVDRYTLQQATSASENIRKKLEQAYMQETRDGLLARVVDWGTTKQDGMGDLLFYDGAHLCTRPDKLGHTRALEVSAMARSVCVMLEEH